MNFTEVPENPFIFLSWVTALGLFLSLSEATIKIKLEKRNSYRKRLELINNQRLINKPGESHFIHLLTFLGVF